MYVYGRPGEADLVALLSMVKTTYNNPEVYVMDPGYGDCGTLYDQDRIDYMKTFISAIAKCIFSVKVMPICFDNVVLSMNCSKCKM